MSPEPLELEGDDYCFGCGADNPIGLRLRFTVDADRRVAEALFTPRDEHQGYAGITHGGLIATLLDEAMLKLCWELGIPAVTARLETEIKKPAPVGEELLVRGRLVEDRGRVIKAEAEILDAAGEVVATGRSTAIVQGPRR
jgi:uncharacterized protein (TIGR00369 family)